MCSPTRTCSVLLVHTRLEVFDESLHGKLRLYALLAPHLAGFGAGNSAWCSELGDNELLRAQREDVHLVVACNTGFCRRSVGYVGFSDGWQDLMQNFKMDWEFAAATDGNIALTGEIDLPDSGNSQSRLHLVEVTKARPPSLFQSLAARFESTSCCVRSSVAARSGGSEIDFSTDTCDDGGMYRLSRACCSRMRTKFFQGAMVASMSIPWGETKGDQDLGGYHLVGRATSCIARWRSSPRIRQARRCAR